ncbi:AHH domain-containing protein [Streptococcus mitis]|uniref:Pre-toxin TG domain-containing protein n=1 Tax=Streptococcus mitis TaxID=28037 RepID=A0A428DB81_STRMT|nr:AHH domain-containing protein [Streptococcus mitis]RSI90118.1 hypothetical protein D8845_08840 [Streptococcus mitis]
MTKDVELHSSTWKTMKQALTGLTETASVSSSGYMNYMNPHSGSYGISRGSTGFGKRVEDLVKISEQVQRLIAEKDTDGVVSYSYHDDTSTGQTLQSKLSTLERYAGNVPTYIKDKIDRPFYEAMDKVGAKLEALNIQQYKTTNKVGYKRIESMTDPYGHPVGTKEVVPAEIGIDELYKVDSPYRTALQKSYEEFKKSKDYKEHKLTETEYVQAMHQTRSFEYVSIDDEKSKIEMWRDIALGVGLVVLTIFCPPAGAVAGVALASVDMYSAATGKDWGTGRELDATERTLRGTFALFDLIPAGKYLGTLAKTGKTAGLTAVKSSLKTTLKEGLEQGTKNLDSFKGVLKNAKGLGDNVLSQIKTYGKQLDNLRPSKILSNSAESLSDGLRHADNVLSEAAQNFRLNIGLEPQLADGVLSSGGGKLSHLADNLSAFAKNLDGSVDDVMEAGSKAGTENFRLIPGEPGVVTGGNSTNLGKNMLEEMGIKRSAKWKGYQAQHIIPSEMASHPVIQKMGMNLDDASNGKFLRIPDDTISPMSRHRGYHSTYNDFVKSKLDQIDINLSPEDLQVEVKKLQRNLNVLQSKGLPLYPNQGATQELWERFYNKLD